MVYMADGLRIIVVLSPWRVSGMLGDGQAWIKFGTGAQVKRWQCSGNFGHDQRSGCKIEEFGEAECFYLCGILGPTSSTSQQWIFTKFGQDTWIDVSFKILKIIFKNFQLIEELLHSRCDHLYVCRSLVQSCRLSASRMLVKLSTS